MRFLGVEKVEDLGMQHVSLSIHKCYTEDIYSSHSSRNKADPIPFKITQINARAVEQQIYDGPAGLHALDPLVRPKL